MAYANSSRAASYRPADRFAGLVKSFRAILARRRVYLTTIRELRTLSDRELSDLGLSRTLIQRVAQEAAYGK